MKHKLRDTGDKIACRTTASVGVAGLAMLLAVQLSANASGASPAAANPPALCHAATARAASLTGVPEQILHALMLTESGRQHDGRVRPWPWAVNMEGTSHWFETRDAARAFITRHQEQGARSFDLGCFQVNHRWHAEAFASIDGMIDPEENALYAARFLQRLHSEFQDWAEAAGAYHSRTPDLAARYRVRFDRFLAQLGQDAGGMAQTAGVSFGEEEKAPGASGQPRPLLIVSVHDGPAPGSLVHRTGATDRPFIALSSRAGLMR